MRFKTRSLRVTILFVILVSSLLAACSPAGSSGESQDITISGAFALYPLMVRWGEEYARLNPEVRIDVSAGGAGKGMADALAGAVDIGMVSRSITAEEEAQGAYWVPVTKDAVFPVVNKANPVIADLLSQGVTLDTFIKIYITGEYKTWGDVVGRPEVTDEIHTYTRSDAAGAPETWAKYLGGKQEDLLGVGVFGDPGLMDAVVKDPLGIGYNNLGYVYDFTSGELIAGAVALPIDINENGQADADEIYNVKSDAVNAVASGLYPSPPARELNLVTKGKPGGAAQAFILWILTDGQKYVGEAGYVDLTPEMLQAALEKVQ